MGLVSSSKNISIAGLILLLVFVRSAKILIEWPFIVTHSVNDSQSWSQYFETFWCFTKFSFHHKVKRCVIISNKHGIYEFPHELPSNLGLGILGN